MLAGEAQTLADYLLDGLYSVAGCLLEACLDTCHRLPGAASMLVLVFSRRSAIAREVEAVHIAASGAFLRRAGSGGLPGSLQFLKFG
jgi:hypothetical protein